MIDAPVQRTARSLPGLEREDVVPVEEDAPLDLRLRRVQPKDRSRDRRLPAARLAREAEDLSSIDLDVDAADGGHVAALRAVRDPEIADREDAHRLTAPGSSG